MDTKLQRRKYVPYTRAPSCPEIPEMSQMSWNCPEISNCPVILLIWSECPDMDLNLQICCHQVASFRAKMHQIWFRRWGSLQCCPRPPLDGFELSNVNWTCVYMLIKVPVCFSSYNSNIYEDRKTGIFCVLSVVKPTKMSWNFLKIGSWNFTSFSWEPCIHHSPCHIIFWKTRLETLQSTRVVGADTKQLSRFRLQITTKLTIMIKMKCEKNIF